MKTEILCFEEITKDVAVSALSYITLLTQEEINEYLDIISAINNGSYVFNIMTNKGEYLFFIKNKIKNTKKKRNIKNYQLLNDNII